MSADLAKLRELLVRVESAAEPLIELDRDIGGTLEAALVNIVEPPRYTSSIDAAVQLCERVLPGWEASGVVLGARSKMAVVKHSPIRPMPVIGKALTPPLALCAAILRAKIAELENA